jgi:hypothetical protein
MFSFGSIAATIKQSYGYIALGFLILTVVAFSDRIMSFLGMKGTNA